MLGGLRQRAAGPGPALHGLRPHLLHRLHHEDAGASSKAWERAQEPQDAGLPDLPGGDEGETGEGGVFTENFRAD